MSDLQDIIAHNAHRAYEQGVTREQERIIKLLEETLLIHTDQKLLLIKAIKAEQ